MLILFLNTKSSSCFLMACKQTTPYMGSIHKHINNIYKSIYMFMGPSMIYFVQTICMTWYGVLIHSMKDKQMGHSHPLLGLYPDETEYLVLTLKMNSLWVSYIYTAQFCWSKNWIWCLHFCTRFQSGKVRCEPDFVWVYFKSSRQMFERETDKVALFWCLVVNALLN